MRSHKRTVKQTAGESKEETMEVEAREELAGGVPLRKPKAKSREGGAMVETW